MCDVTERAEAGVEFVRPAGVRVPNYSRCFRSSPKAPVGSLAWTWPRTSAPAPPSGVRLEHDALAGSEASDIHHRGEISRQFAGVVVFVRLRLSLCLGGLAATQAGLGVMGVFLPPYAAQHLGRLLRPV